MRLTRGLAVPVLIAALTACASTPKQTVDLSITLGRDIEAVHSAHVALANTFFDRMESDINSFVDGTYRPYSIEHNLRDFDLVAKIKDPAKAEGADPLDVMDVFVDQLTSDIEDMRRTLLAPVRAQRAKVLASLEDVYRRIQDGQAIVTAHLASLTKVQDAQEQAFAKMGLQGLREKLVDTTAAASEQIEKLTRQAASARDDAQAFQNAMNGLKKATQSLGQ